MNVDHGTLPAAIRKIKEDLNIDYENIGLLGSLVFFGNLIGSLISFWIIKRFHRKYILIIFLTLNIICLLAFQEFTNNIQFLFINRVYFGISQVTLAF